jgi:hypothetical protein
MDLTRPSVPVALAVRRQVVAAGAIGASVVAHCAPEGDLETAPGAPVVWGGALAMVTLLGGRRRWRPRGFAGSLVLMAGAQAGVHLAMSAVPWAFGLAVHHQGGVLVAPDAAAWHAAAALVLAALVTWLETLCGRAMDLVVRLRRLLRPRPARAAATRGVARPDASRPRVGVHGRLTCRGPPRPRPA